MHETLANWIMLHSGVLVAIGAVSFLLLLASLLAMPWFLAKLPVNYFVLPPKPIPRTAFHLLVSTLRTVIGIALLLTGILMFVTPGPGLAVVILGVILIDLPGKHRLQRWLVRQPRVFKLLNWLRSRASTPPFIQPSADDTL